MKKTAHILAAAALMFGLAGCAQKEMPAEQDNEEVSVTVSAALNGNETGTKAYGETGELSTANRVILEVYMKDSETPELYGKRLYAKAIRDRAEFNDVRLLTGHNYLFVLWADKVADPSTDTGIATDNYYNTGDSLSAVTYNVTTLPGNTDDADAFYAAVEKKITKTETAVNATLIRPFGQLNIYTKDYDDIPMDDLKPAKIAMEFKALPAGIDLVKETLLEETKPMNVEAVAIAEAEPAVTADPSKGRRLGFNYIFTMAENAEDHLLGEFSMSFLKDDGTTPVADAFTFPANIPVQRNYRTNVTGNLLTGGVTVKVEIAPVFSQPDNIVNILPNGVTEESFEQNNAEAYGITADGRPAYYTTAEQALEAGATEIYLKPGSQATLSKAHVNVLGNLTIYANGADFGNKDISVDTYTTYTEDVNIEIYDAKNLYVWGEVNDDVVRNIKMVNCHNTGTASEAQPGRLIYLSGTTGTTNITLEKCTVNKVDSPVYSNANGTITLTGCGFTECAVPVNINYKSATGEQNVIIDGCSFDKCGSEAEHTVGDGTLGDYAAPIRVVHSVAGSTHSLTVKNTSVTNTLGVNGDVLLAINKGGTQALTATFEKNPTELKVLNTEKGTDNLTVVSAGESTVINVEQ